MQEAAAETCVAMLTRQSFCVGEQSSATLQLETHLSPSSGGYNSAGTEPEYPRDKRTLAVADGHADVLKWRRA